MCRHIILLCHHVLVFILTSLLSSFLDGSCIVVMDRSTLLSCYTFFASPQNKILTAILSLLKFFLSVLVTLLLFNKIVLHFRLSTSLPFTKTFLDTSVCYASQHCSPQSLVSPFRYLIKYVWPGLTRAVFVRRYLQDELC